MAISRKTHPRLSILGIHFSFLPRLKVYESIINMAHHGISGYVCVSNVHTTMTAFWDKTYRKVQNESSFTVPDGVPLVWAMNLLRSKHTAPQDRVRGPTMMRELCGPAKEGLRHYLFGGSPEALRALEAYLRKENPKIQIVGLESPPFRPSWSDEEIQIAVDRIKKTGANIVWVGLGAPKQERWMAAAAKFNPSLLVGVGAAFDLLPGLIPEAPMLMQSMGLEWLYRLWREPRRLWQRYVFHNPVFLVLFTLQWLSSVLFRRNYLCESSARE